MANLEAVFLLRRPPLAWLGVLDCLSSLDFPHWTSVSAEFMSSCFSCSPQIFGPPDYSMVLWVEAKQDSLSPRWVQLSLGTPLAAWVPSLREDLHSSPIFQAVIDHG